MNISSLFFSSDLPGAAGQEYLKDLLLGNRPATPEALAPETAEEPSSDHPLKSLLLEGEALPGLRHDVRSMLQSWIDPEAAESPSYESAGFHAPSMVEAHPSASSPARMSASIIQLLASHPNSAHAPGLSSYLNQLLEIRERIMAELRENLVLLLSLNPSRREALASHLDWISGEPATPARDKSIAAASLRRWIEGPRSDRREQALATYLEEVAMICLGQAVLLKAWADRGIRAGWSKADLGKLNWTLGQALKTFIPMDREGWQITRPNLYSWYNLGPELQGAVWETLRGWDLKDEGPGLLVGLLRLSRKHQPNWPELRGYDLRFFCSLWEKMGHFGFRAEREPFRPFQTERFVYSPTLRDGSMVRTAPEDLCWVGAESYPFQLMMAELAELWWGPKQPPLWTTGSGLDTHTREQLALKLSSPKPSLVSRIAEREDCELSFVLEERAIRLQDRCAEAAHLRAELDQLPYFKSLRSGGTSLGLLQACVAATKLRPGGLLWWTRETPLSQSEGAEALRFLLERCQILCEWDLAGVTHTLPVKLPLFPRYVYVFRREPRADLRRSHRPQKVRVEGEIRSHVEVPAILEEALSTYQPNPGSGIQGAFGGGELRLESLLDLAPAREPAPNTRRHDHFNWTIHHQVSPLCQQDWAERWPDPAAQTVVKKLDSLRSRSVPLGQLVAVRSLSVKENQSAQEKGWAQSAIARQTLWVRQSRTETGRALVAQPVSAQTPPPEQAGFIVVAPDAMWVPALAAFLESPMVREWLDHFCEQKNGHWQLTEQNLKFIPLPNSLAEALKAQAGESELDLPDPWNRILPTLAFQPRTVLEELRRIGHDPASSRIRSRVFVRAARTQAELRTAQGRLLSLVNERNQIRWREFIQILPRSERMSFQLHPQVHMTGSLPPHLPISDIQKIKAPARGVLLATEGGLNVHVVFEDDFLLELFWEQIQGLRHPTWSELTRFVELPRQTELASSTASDILRSHSEQVQRLAELSDLIAACLEH